MKDLDVERQERHRAREEALGDRTFMLGGETFTFRANVQYGVLARVSEITTDTSGATVIETLEKTVLDLIEPDGDALERFMEVCSRKDDPITFQDLNSLATWLIEEQVQSPTVAPSPSTDGDAPTGTPSTDNSSGQVAVASPA